MNRTAKVALACFIGTALGIITMHGLYPSLWPLGLVMGFLGGYMSYEYKTVIQAIPVAWHEATTWRPNKVWWRAYFKVIGNYVSIALIGASFFIIWAIVFTIHFYRVAGAGSGEPTILWGILGLASLVLVVYSFGPTLFFLTQSRETLEKESEKISIPTLFHFYFQLLPLWFGECYWLLAQKIPAVIDFLFEIVPVAVRFIGKFVWHYFKLIHKEERLLCGIDAAIGSAVFHYAGNNVFLGLAVGVAWGVLNFEVFSIRVLKLVPAEASILYRIRR